MALTTQNSKQAKAVGSFTEFAYGIAGGSGTSTVVTCPTMSKVLGAVVSSATSSTGAFVDTVSTNTFTCTTASNDLFCYIAFGIPRI